MELTLEEFKDRYTKENKSGCWIWQKATNANGPQTFYRKNGKNYGLTGMRKALLIKEGKFYPSEWYITPSCGNRLCVNPDHANFFIKSGVDRDIKGLILSKTVKTNSGCWEWQGILDDRGYGVFRHLKKLIKSHRASYMAFNDLEFLEKTNYVCHKCDNPPCCNPEHLFLGTHAENMADMVAKGRSCPAKTRKRFTGTELYLLEYLLIEGSTPMAHIAKLLKVDLTTVYKRRSILRERGVIGA